MDKNSMKVSELLKALTPDLIIDHSLGDDPDIAGVAAIDEANSTQMSYVEGGKFAAMVGTTEAKALVLPDDKDLQ